MKIGAMIEDILPALFKRPVTERYPVIRQPTPVQLRGKLYFDPSRCVGCQLCVKDCTSEAIDLITIDKATKRFVLRYYIDRCTFCGQCVKNCRFNCLEMSPEEWELASLEKEPFTVYYGNETDIQAYLAKESMRSLGEAAED